VKGGLSGKNNSGIILPGTEIDQFMKYVDRNFVSNEMKMRITIVSGELNLSRLNELHDLIEKDPPRWIEQFAAASSARRIIDAIPQKSELMSRFMNFAITCNDSITVAQFISSIPMLLKNHDLRRVFLERNGKIRVVDIFNQFNCVLSPNILHCLSQLYSLLLCVGLGL
jgi:hypothetical protein